MAATEGVSTERSLTEASAANLFEQLIDDTVDTTGEEQQVEGEAVDEVEGEQDIDQDTESEDGESDEEAEPAAPSKYRVKVGGEELEVTLDEALKGYSRTEDYTRKTQKLAERQKAFEAEARAVQAERARYAASLQELEQIVRSSNTEHDWQQLRATLSPEDFSAAWADHQIAQTQLKQLEEERQNIALLQQQDALRTKAQRLELAKEELLIAVPEWKDAEKARGELSEMADFVLTRGFPSGTFDSIDDPKIFLLVRDAMKYAKLQKAKPVVAKNGSAVPTKPAVAAAPAQNVIRPLAAGSAVTKKPANELVRARQRLAKSGSDRDAASVFEQLL